MVDPMHHPFAREKLDCYRLTVAVARWLQQASFPSGRAELRKQGQDAADSIVLNIAEGARRRQGKGDAGKNPHEIAHGSAAECCAVLDLVTIDGAEQQQQKLRRIGAMLAKLARQRRPATRFRAPPNRLSP